MAQKEGLQQEERGSDTRLSFKVAGCDTLTSYERRVLYQVEELASKPYFMERVFSWRGNPTCLLEIKFKRSKGAAEGNVAHAIEHLVVYTAKGLGRRTGFKGSLSGVTFKIEGSLVINLSSNSCEAEGIFLRAVEIVTGAVNKRLLIKTDPERQVSFLPI